MGPNTGSNIFGIITFVAIVAIALAAIAVIIYGRRLKVRRLTAEKDLIERREAAHVDAVVVEPDAPIAETPEKLAPAPMETIGETPVAAPPAPKAKAAPKAKSVARVETAPKTKAAPKPETAPKPKAAPKAATPAPTVAPKAKAAASTKAAPKAEAAAPAAATTEAAPKAKASKAKVAPKADAAPKTEAVPAPTASDADITQLKGLGPKLATTLAEMGYTRLDQIAALTPDQAAELDARLGAFQGRMARDRWIEQATLLAAGDRAAYEAAFGKLG